MDYVLNPYNSRTRADGQGVRPDLLHLLGETVVTKQDMNSNLQELHQATEALAQSIDPEHPDSHLWLMNQRIEEEQNLALERHEELIQANLASIDAMRKPNTHSIFMNWDETTADSDYLTLTRTSSTRVAWTIEPGWVGNFGITAATGSSTTAFGTGIYMRKLPVPNAASPSFTNDGGIGSVQVTINVEPGKSVTVSPTIPDQEVSRDWMSIATWTVPQDTQVTANASLWWSAKNRAGDYGMRIMVGGSNATSSTVTRSVIGEPSAPRPHSVAMSPRHIPAGTLVSLQVKADHLREIYRRIRDASFNVTWIDNTEAAE